MKDSSPFMKFKYIEHCEFKGKSVNLPIFQPIELETEIAETDNDQFYPYWALKLHANPFIVDRDNKFQETYCKVYGRQEELESVVNEIIDFCSDLKYSFAVSINGQSG